MKASLPTLALLSCLACQGPSPAPAPDEASARVEVIVLAHVDAVETAAVLEDLVRSAGEGAEAPALEVLADARTNSLLVRADDALLEQLRALVAALDTDRAAGG